MQQNRGSFPACKAVILQAFLLTAIALKYGFTSHPGWYKLLYITIPLLVAVSLYSYRKNFRLPNLKKLKPFTLNS